MPLPIRELLSGRGIPVTALQDEGAVVVLERMGANDFSQLPVVDDQGRLLGAPKMVTYESVLRAMRAFGVTAQKVRVADAVAPCSTVAHDADLLDVLDRIRDEGAVLAIDE